MFNRQGMEGPGDVAEWSEALCEYKQKNLNPGLPLAKAFF